MSTYLFVTACDPARCRPESLMQDCLLAYADDLASPAGELYAAIVTAPYAPATFDPATDVDA